MALLDLLDVEDPDDRSEALVLIRELDGVWLRHSAERAKRAAEKDPRGKGPRSRGGR